MFSFCCTAVCRRSFKICPEFRCECGWYNCMRSTVWFISWFLNLRVLYYNCMAIWCLFIGYDLLYDDLFFHCYIELIVTLWFDTGYLFINNRILISKIAISGKLDYRYLVLFTAAVPTLTSVRNNDHFAVLSMKS